MLQKEEDMKKQIILIEERYKRMIAATQNEQFQKNGIMKEMSPRKSGNKIEMFHNIGTASFTPLRKQRVS